MYEGWTHKQYNRFSTFGEATLIEDNYESSKVLIVSSNINDCEYIMHYRCSFHMLPNHLWFQTFKKLEEGSFIIGDSKSCNITNIGTDKFCLHDETNRMLEEVSYVPTLKRN